MGLQPPPYGCSITPYFLLGKVYSIFGYVRGPKVFIIALFDYVRGNYGMGGM